MDATALLTLLRKKAFAKAYEAARTNPALVNTFEEGDPDDVPDTPFHWACRFGDQATMREFMALGADVAKANSQGEVPIELVADGSPYATAAHVEARTAMVQALLAAKSPLGDTSLLRACSLGAGKAHEMVKLLISAGAKGDSKKENGETVLHLACEYDLPEALDYCLSLGAVVDARTSPSSFAGGSTALHIAAKKRRTSMVEKLVAAGAKVDIVNKRKETPLSLANGALRKIMEGKPVAAPAKRPKAADPHLMLEQLRKAPRDPALLAVYADWLIAQGETSRGEYIGLRLLPKPTAEQRKRADQLLKKDRGRWLGEARKLTSEWVDSETSPGFVASATVSAENLLGHFEALRALGPELTLRITPVKTRLLTKKLAELPLGRLHGLHFYNTKGTFSMNRDWLDDTALGILGPSLAGLQSLVLAPAIQADEGRGFTPRAFEHLKPASVTLRALTVDFTESHPDPSLLAALTPAAFPKLETLTITGLEATRRKRLKTAWAKGAAALVFA